MPTNDERREVAARLRKFESDSVGSYSEFCEKLDEVIGCGERQWTCDRLADLIEPEPERTCRNEFDRCFAFECSECGVNVEGGDMLGHNSSEGAFNFCPNCGAKVVGE